ncbi:MAG TPA: hypothetical protein IGS53_14175 [Leptolyngbyaceae cyanobacterium M33_DOE_097]|uniref:Uncharacterized protein n=1 Tax=Oscillatoriales cyanobacterium SpSt-418 TaxID=2282169 RepID=A0A7C3KGJ5_9CYAN|nr:hypothetical protein [Leptolyngbyaceae cyanobacterium M33_DOE_097]
MVTSQHRSASPSLPAFVSSSNSSVSQPDSFSDNHSTLSNIEISGTHSDMLEYLLRDRSWIALSAYLFHRSVVTNSHGWDERLCAGQDRDFLLSVALTGATFAYLPGCYSFYRRHGTGTVSTASQAKWLEGHFMLMKKVEEKLVQTEKFTEKYRQALAASYFDKATSWCLFLTSNQYLRILKHAYHLDPNVTANSSVFQALESVFGFSSVATLFYRLKQIRYFGKAKKYNPFQTS